MLFDKSFLTREKKKNTSRTYKMVVFYCIQFVSEDAILFKIRISVYHKFSAFLLLRSILED